MDIQSWTSVYHIIGVGVFMCGSDATVMLESTIRTSRIEFQNLNCARSFSKHKFRYVDTAQPRFGVLGSPPMYTWKQNSATTQATKINNLPRRLQRACTSFIYSVIARWFERIRSGLDIALSCSPSGLWACFYWGWMWRWDA